MVDPRRRGGKPAREVRWRDEDIPALAALCSLLGLVRVEDALVPCVVPGEEYADPADFDRALVRAGLPEYIRPRHPRDWPGGVDPGGGSVWVRRLAPGLRVRRAVEVYFPGEN
jgi:hypothetical protein